jgi:hypothetical protein
MRVRDAMRFPYPVLWDVTGDYLIGEFSLGGVSVTENLLTGSVAVNYSVELTQPEVRGLVESECARLGAFVTCLDTYYSKFHDLSIHGGTLSLVGGQLMGLVQIRPVAWASTQIDQFEATDLHPEFGDEPQQFSPRAIIGIGEEVRIIVGRDKLAPIASIFDLSISDHVPPQQFAVQLDGDKIVICASGDTHAKLSQMRGTYQHRAVMLNSVYMPAVMSVIAAIQGGETQYEGKRWHAVFTAKATYLGIDLESADPLAAAQLLLKSPLGRLTNDIEAHAS